MGTPSRRAATSITLMSCRCQASGHCNRGDRERHALAWIHADNAGLKGIGLESTKVIHRRAHERLPAHQHVDELCSRGDDDRFLPAPASHKVGSEELLQKVDLIEARAGGRVLDHKLASLEFRLEEISP